MLCIHTHIHACIITDPLVVGLVLAELGGQVVRGAHQLLYV